MASVGSLLAAAESGGLLGARYVEVEGGAIDSLNTARLGAFGAARVTLPVLARTDVALGYDYRRFGTASPLEAFEVAARSQGLHASVTEYAAVRGIKPFATAGVGYRWTERDLRFGGVHVATMKHDGTDWRAGVGAELPAGRVTVTPAVTYRAGFDGSARTFTYGLQAHTWLTPRVGAFAAVAYDDPQPRHDDVSIASARVGSVAVVRPEDDLPAAWTYSVGARFRF